MFKKLLSLMCIAGIIIAGIPAICSYQVDASGNTNYLMSVNAIETEEEWKDFAEENGIERDRSFDDCCVVDFSIAVDSANGTFDVDTVYLTDNRSTTTSGSATHSVYSNSGTLLFTLTVEGTFTRISGLSCTCTSATGSFTHPVASLWRSTPSYLKGRKSATKAYAKMYGTATKTIGSGSITYQFFLYCNAEGVLTSAYSES